MRGVMRVGWKADWKGGPMQSRFFPAPVCVMLGLILGLASCNSVYHRSSKVALPDVRTRLATRVQDARDSAQDLSRVLMDGAIPDAQVADRAEGAAWDFGKRVASVQDVLERL